MDQQISQNSEFDQYSCAICGLNFFKIFENNESVQIYPLPCSDFICGPCLSTEIREERSEIQCLLCAEKCSKDFAKILRPNKKIEKLILNAISAKTSRMDRICQIHNERVIPDKVCFEHLIPICHICLNEHNNPPCILKKWDLEEAKNLYKKSINNLYNLKTYILGINDSIDNLISRLNFYLIDNCTEISICNEIKSKYAELSSLFNDAKGIFDKVVNGQVFGEDIYNRSYLLDYSIANNLMSEMISLGIVKKSHNIKYVCNKNDFINYTKIKPLLQSNQDFMVVCQNTNKSINTYIITKSMSYMYDIIDSRLVSIFLLDITLDEFFQIKIDLCNANIRYVNFELFSINGNEILEAERLYELPPTDVIANIENIPPNHKFTNFRSLQDYFNLTHFKNCVLKLVKGDHYIIIKVDSDSMVTLIRTSQGYRNRMIHKIVNTQNLRSNSESYISSSLFFINERFCMTCPWNFNNSKELEEFQRHLQDINVIDPAVLDCILIYNN